MHSETLIAQKLKILKHISANAAGSPHSFLFSWIPSCLKIWSIISSGANVSIDKFLYEKEESILPIL